MSSFFWLSFIRFDMFWTYWYESVTIKKKKLTLIALWRL